jgi:hypothetical protein
MTDAQIKWSEYRIFSETHSMDDVRSRVRSDADFASFVRKNYEREFEQVGDAATILGTTVEGRVPTVSAQERNRLIQFATVFNALPASEAKKQFLVAFNPQHQTFAKDFEICRQLRLL